MGESARPQAAAATRAFSRFRLAPIADLQARRLQRPLMQRRSSDHPDIPINKFRAAPAGVLDRVPGRVELLIFDMPLNIRPQMQYFENFPLSNSSTRLAPRGMAGNEGFLALQRTEARNKIAP
jgi:hypothetical protein